MQMQGHNELSAVELVTPVAEPSMIQLAKRVVLTLLQGYKYAVSPLFPPACRYVPSCSDYASEAIDRYGVVRGGWKAIKRLLRCHPFAEGGFDPVVRIQQQQVCSEGSSIASRVAT
jgi:putative membrane protein insertion efficiency factor